MAVRAVTIVACVWVVNAEDVTLASTVALQRMAAALDPLIYDGTAADETEALQMHFGALKQNDLDPQALDLASSSSSSCDFDLVNADMAQTKCHFVIGGSHGITSDCCTAWKTAGRASVDAMHRSFEALTLLQDRTHTVLDETKKLRNAIKAKDSADHQVKAKCKNHDSDKHCSTPSAFVASNAVPGNTSQLPLMVFAAVAMMAGMFGSLVTMRVFRPHLRSSDGGSVHDDYFAA